MPLQGGLRVGFTPKESDPALPEAHAGDEVVILTLAHLPLVYRDAGAFNRREFLANQEIDLVATFRAVKLLEVVGTPRAWYMCHSNMSCAGRVFCGTGCRWIFFGRIQRRMRRQPWPRIMIRWWCA